MADISQHLKAIQTAKYGEEVRGSIHDALEAMNEELSSAKEVAETAQDSAKASATSAANSASSAKTSETNAKSSETKAALYLSFFDALKEAVEACIFSSALLDSDGNPILDSDGASITTETKGLDGFRNALINVPTDVFALSQQMKHCIMDSND